jgi:hypothetical protein
MNACEMQGRGSFIPASHYRSSTDIHTDAINGLEHRPDFPRNIQVALARASGSDAPGFADLSVKGRILLARILRNVCTKHPEQPVRISNECLAVAMGCSTRTVQRVKGELASAGWIERHQVQSRRHGMQISDVRLTDVALARLGLGADAAPKKSEGRPNKNHASRLVPVAIEDGARRGQGAFAKPTPASDNTVARLSDSPIFFKETTQGSFEQKMNAEPSRHSNRSNTTPAAEPAAAPSMPPKLPTDLGALHPRISTYGIYRLMAIAGQKRQRLSDVVAALGIDRIAQLNNPYAYLRRVLEADRDWAYMAEQKAKPVQPNAPQQPAENSAQEQSSAEGAEATLRKQERASFKVELARLSELRHEADEFRIRMVGDQVLVAQTRRLRSYGDRAWAVVLDAQLTGYARLWTEGRLRAVDD